MKMARMLRIVAVGLVLAGLAGQAGGGTWYVDANGSADFTTIQAALDDPCTVDGDEIEVAAGTYYEAINLKGKGVRLYSSGGPGVTIINANGAYHVVKCMSGEDANTILEGFTITGGVANGASWPDYHGAGMVNSATSPMVTNCIFSGNQASEGGGGMLNNWSNPTVTNCTFSYNSAGTNGGGIYNYESSPTVTNCTFSNNPAQWGGGMYNYGNNSSPTVTDCNFYENQATDSGGGMYNNISSPTVTNCRLCGNSAGSNGGGMFNNGSNPAVANCTLAWNWANGIGGGMLNSGSDPTVTNCTFSYNSASVAGGLYNLNSGPTVSNCTFSGNTATSSGGGIRNYLFSSPTVTNCILWGNSPGQMADDASSSAVVRYSDVQGGWSGTGNIDAYPVFVDAGEGDFRLGTFSPCVDAGNNASVPADSVDLDGDGNTVEPIPFDLGGEPRFVDDTGVADTGAGTAPIVDMGAYERQVQSVENGRSQTRLDHFWRFAKGNIADANQAGFDDSEWRIVSVPHDWSIEDLTRETGPFLASAVGHWDTGYMVGGTAWYRNTFNLDANDSNKIVHLQFDGVYMNSDVWVNGTHVGNRPYGYSTFWFDITDDVNFGAENVIAVEVKNEGKNTRWYSGSGMYRPVTVTITDKVHIAHWGPYITTPVVSTSSADVIVRTEVKNESDSNETVTLESTILDSNGVAVATDSEIFSIPGVNSYDFNQTLAVSNPNLWSIDSPMLYTLSQHVYVSGQIVDHVETAFGIRSILFDATNGFLLNGENVLLQGGCMHHDNYMLGSACFDRAEERRVEIMKAAGYNAIRTSHNPPSQAFLHACDHIGVLVIDEAFDMWNCCKWDHVYDYSRYFANWWQADINSMVLRDRNHASIIMWSIGNEIPEQDATLGIDTADMLAAYVRSLDPTRPVTLGVNRSGASYDPYFATLDVAGYNYQLGSYTSEHARVPGRVMFGSESYAKNAFDYWEAVEDYSYVIGDFVWTAYDYLGEASIGWTGYKPDWSGIGPYPWHLAYCGDIDACGYKRPAAYYRDVLWKTGQNKVSAFVTSPTPSLPDYDPSWNRQWVYPDIHPSWTWPGYEGTNLQVTVYSECDTVALFLNDVNLGTQATSNSTEYTATWDVNYAPGELKAIGYISAVPQAEWILNTAGAHASIQLTADKSTIAADGSSLCYVTAELLDGSGNAVYDPNEDKLISFDINGPGKLAGVGNANPCGTESFQRPERMTFRGRCVAVVKSTLRTGTITLTASSSGLTSDSVVIQTTGGVTSNTAPVASDDSYSVYSVEILDVWLYGVTSNDMDAELDPLSAILVSDVSNGTLTLNADGTFEYDPNDTFTGTDSFTYKANDGDANSNVATVTIDVKPSAPVANDDYYNAVQDTVLSVAADSGVLANDITYGGALSAILVSEPNNGSLTLDSNGAFDYDPCSGFIGMDSFTYKANDGTYDSNIAAVFIDVLDAHPIAYDDSYSVVQNTVLVVDANSGVLANDYSPSGGPLSATVVSGPNNGSLILNSDGSFRYDPNNTFAGTDSFTYYASAGGYDSGTAKVRISVMAPLTVINPSFELDGSGNYITCHTYVGIGWTAVNNWVGVDIYCGAPGACVNCRSPVPPDGNCYSFMQTNNTYLYQVVADRIIDGGQYTFTFDAQTGNSGADIGPSMFYVNDNNSHVQITSSTIPLSTGAWNNDLSVSFTAAAGQAYLGKKLGIKLHAPIPGDMDTGKWIFLDNVRLDLRFAADFNGDYVVNFLDYAELAAAWKSSVGQPAFNDIYDLHDDDTIDTLDLRLFSDDWLLGLRPLDLWFAADFNGDDKVNFFDYAKLADAWQSFLGQPAFNDIYDLCDDDIIDILDVDIFVEKWLWQTGP